VLRYDTVYETIDDPALLEDFFDEDAKMHNPSGSYGVRYWIGTLDSQNEDQPMLRIDLDPRVRHRRKAT
jgi:hypothetical protein